MQLKKVPHYDEPGYPTLESYQKARNPIVQGSAALLAAAMLAGSAGCANVATAGTSLAPEDAPSTTTETTATATTTAAEPLVATAGDYYSIPAGTTSTMHVPLTHAGTRLVFTSTSSSTTVSLAGGRLTDTPTQLSTAGGILVPPASQSTTDASSTTTDTAEHTGDSVTESTGSSTSHASGMPTRCAGLPLLPDPAESR